MTTEDPTARPPVAEPVGDPGARGAPPGGGEGGTFPRRVVEELRREAAGYRTRAQRADEAMQRLMTATIEKTTTGILADPSDLPASEDLHGEDGWPDPQKVEAAARDLVSRKPHLAVRSVAGDVGQGVRGDEAEEPFSLAAALRAGAA